MQYTARMKYMKVLSERCQTTKMNFRVQVYQAKTCTKSLCASSFPMAENLTKVIELRGANLTIPQLNQLAKKIGFESDDISFEDKYDQEYEMLPSETRVNLLLNLNG